jgi:hypothetical protein
MVFAAVMTRFPVALMVSATSSGVLRNRRNGPVEVTE